jgi:hypothetical protein
MPQSNLALLYDDYSPRLNYSGGSWQTKSLVLSNVKTPYISEVARSIDLNPANTKFRVSTPGTALEFGGFAIGPANFTTKAKVRIVAYLDVAATLQVYDSGWADFRASIVPSLSLSWQDSHFWTGDNGDFDDFAKGVTMVVMPKGTVYATTIDVFIDDQANPAGYLEVSRFYGGKKYVPKYNYAVDSNSLGFEAITDVEQGVSGTRFYNPRAMRRVFRFAFPNEPDPGFANIYRLVARSGIHNQVVVIPNPADPKTYVREAFIGNLDELPSLKRLFGPYVATDFVIKEAL